jgi:hypothetical protein
MTDERRWAMRRCVLLAAGAALALTGCQSEVGTTAGGDCTSHYEDVATAPTLRDLEATLVDGTVPRGRSVRVVGHHDGKTTINVLDRRHRVVAEVDAWRRRDGSWYAGQWAQCID